jgi:hypothetical protein
MPGRVAVVVHRARCFRVPSALATWGHDSVPSICYVRPSASSTCGVRVARAPVEPIGKLGVQCAGPVAIVRLGAKNQLVAVAPSLL